MSHHKLGKSKPGATRRTSARHDMTSITIPSGYLPKPDKATFKEIVIPGWRHVTDVHTQVDSDTVDLEVSTSSLSYMYLCYIIAITLLRIRLTIHTRLCTRNARSWRYVTTKTRCITLLLVRNWRDIMLTLWPRKHRAPRMAGVAGGSLSAREISLKRRRAITWNQLIRTHRLRMLCSQLLTCLTVTNRNSDTRLAWPCKSLHNKHSHLFSSCNYRYSSLLAAIAVLDSPRIVC